MATSTEHKSVFRFLGVPAPFDSEHTLVTSPVLPPLVLAILRLSLALYGLVFVLYRIIFEGVTSHSDGSYVARFGKIC